MTLDRFVVGTGRCGSTLLARMLAEHREVVSLNEFFTGLDWGRRFPTGTVAGDEVADLVATPNDVVTQVLSRGYDAEEIQYRFLPGDRYGRADPVPWILVSMLSRLADEADALFDETMGFLQGRESLPIADHYRDLFTWVTHRVGGSVWVERSGSSVDYLGDLVRLFPDGRFVHLHRDGREAALSIRAHPFYRLAVSLLYDCVPTTDGDEDVVTALLESAPPVDLFGRYWSDQLLHGLGALADLDRDQYLAICFEDVIADPGAAMRDVAAFLELPTDGGFPERAAALVEGTPRARFDDLPPDEQDALVEACRPGQLLLGRDRDPPPTTT